MIELTKGLEGIIWDGNKPMKQDELITHLFSPDAMTAKDCWVFWEEPYSFASAYDVLDVFRTIADEVASLPALPEELDQALQSGIVTNTVIAYDKNQSTALIKSHYYPDELIHLGQELPYTHGAARPIENENPDFIKGIFLTDLGVDEIAKILKKVSRTDHVFIYRSMDDETDGVLRPVSIGYSVSIPGALYIGTSIRDLHGTGCSMGVLK